MMPSASPKQRVLIVGAKFGEMYLNAFMQPPEGLELVGLLAQGSARSRELAHAFGIPLYTSPEQITGMPDIACIVVRSTVAGGTGTQLARHFLARGVHVTPRVDVARRKARPAGAPADFRSPSGVQYDAASPAEPRSALAQGLTPARCSAAR